MTDENDRHARLLAEVFQDDWEKGPARHVALRAAAYARRRRRLRRATAAGGLMLMVALLSFLALPGHTKAPEPVAPVTRASDSPAYEIISDDEFVALLGTRPVLILPQQNGSTRVVLVAR
jgi:hypothetical protein